MVKSSGSVVVKPVRAWYLSSGCVVVDRGPCVVLDEWIFNSGLWSELGNTAVAVW
jgi:hypothetical protein